MPNSKYKTFLGSCHCLVTESIRCLRVLVRKLVIVQGTSTTQFVCSCHDVMMPFWCICRAHVAQEVSAVSDHIKLFSS